MPARAIVSREQSLQARNAHLANEKEFNQRRVRPSAERRALPWVRIEPRARDSCCR